MSPQEIIDQFSSYVDLHEQEMRGSIHQDPYKSDFFGLFAEAYNNGYMANDHSPRLTADGLRDALPQHLALETPLFQELLTFWQEWTYAWNRHAEYVGR